MPDAIFEKHRYCCSTTPQQGRLAEVDCNISNLRGHPSSNPAHGLSLRMNTNLNCCCGCGNQVEPGRKVHVCSETGRSLFAGFCQSSEEVGPCRRCAGNTDFEVPRSVSERGEMIHVNRFVMNPEPPELGFGVGGLRRTDLPRSNT